MEQILLTQIVAVMLIVVIVGILVDLALLAVRLFPVSKKISTLMIEYYKQRYPFVSEEFMLETQEQQLIENNQEIHELNKRVTHFEELTAGYKDKLDVILEKLSTK